MSGRDKTWMKATWLRLSLDKMKVVYGFGKGKVFWVDKNLLSKLREIPVVKMHKGFTTSYLILSPSYKSDSNPFVSC